ncbi:uncharacterized protein J3R85_005555 [Psidium guajava]|nr:uncharacterized protein J3R85_005555 [Psidium guajava]
MDPKGAYRSVLYGASSPDSFLPSTKHLSGTPKSPNLVQKTRLRSIPTFGTPMPLYLLQSLGNRVKSPYLKVKKRCPTIAID